jgi:hypothetical protein
MNKNCLKWYLFRIKEIVNVDWISPPNESRITNDTRFLYPGEKRSLSMLTAFTSFASKIFAFSKHIIKTQTNLSAAAG